MTEFAFTPETIEVQVGQKVVLHLWRTHLARVCELFPGLEVTRKKGVRGRWTPPRTPFFRDFTGFRLNGYP